MTQIPETAANYFPYQTVRPYQNLFITTILNAVQQRRSVTVEGSNGLGKTVAALSACLPEALEHNLKLLYLARTHRQNERVIEELKKISRKQEVTGLSIRGRHEMCLNPAVKNEAHDSREVMEMCELLKAKQRCIYYRNLEEKKRRFIETQQSIISQPCTASEIQKTCKNKGFCPYELTKTCLTNVNVIASSYLYLFDPSIRNSFLKNLDTPLEKTIVIVDEAHNLPETAASIASSTLTLYTARQAEAEAKEFKHREISRFCKLLQDEIMKLARKTEKEAHVAPETLLENLQKKGELEDPEELFENMCTCGYAIKQELLANGKSPRSFIHSTGTFLIKWQETAGDKSFTNIIVKYKSRRGTETARLEIDALDPSKITEPVFSETYANVIMSGTLQPLEAYIRITGLPDDTVKTVLPSPFPKENVLPLICCEVTTAMEERTPKMYNEIIKRISEVVQCTPANTGVFAASFLVLENLRANGLDEQLDKPAFYEHRGMTSKDNEKIVKEFKAQAQAGGSVLLAVQGGRSSEGVDFPGNEMNSAVIVGVPYAEPTSKIKAQIQYFEDCYPGFGREYGYTMPAMKKASQAAGRPIRTLTDRAAMIFLDRRFASPYCQQFLPSWIRNNLNILPRENKAISRELNQFFRRAS